MKAPERRGSTYRFRDAEDEEPPARPPPFRMVEEKEEPTIILAPPPVPNPPESLATEGTKFGPPVAEDGERPWNPDMGTAPMDGAIVELRRADGTVLLAMARRTRAKVRIGWELLTFFADPVTRHRIHGEIVAWRRPDGFLTDTVRGRL